MYFPISIYPRNSNYEVSNYCSRAWYERNEVISLAIVQWNLPSYQSDDGVLNTGKACILQEISLCSHLARAKGSTSSSWVVRSESFIAPETM